MSNPMIWQGVAKFWSFRKNTWENHAFFHHHPFGFLLLDSFVLDFASYSSLATQPLLAQLSYLRVNVRSHVPGPFMHETLHWIAWTDAPTMHRFEIHCILFGPCISSRTGAKWRRNVLKFRLESSVDPVKVKDWKKWCVMFDFPQNKFQILKKLFICSKMFGVFRSSLQYSLSFKSLIVSTMSVILLLTKT